MASDPSGSYLVRFRAGEVESEILVRTPGEGENGKGSAIARRDLNRYYEALRDELERFTRDMKPSVETAMQVTEILKPARGRVTPIMAVELQHAFKLGGEILPFITYLALLDASERYWLAVGKSKNGANKEALLAQVGLS